MSVRPPCRPFGGDRLAPLESDRLIRPLKHLWKNWCSTRVAPHSQAAICESQPGTWPTVVNVLQDLAGQSAICPERAREGFMTNIYIEFDWFLFRFVSFRFVDSTRSEFVALSRRGFGLNRKPVHWPGAPKIWRRQTCSIHISRLWNISVNKPLAIWILN